MSLAIFRCDASPEIGAGHLMRCLAFAETLTWASWSTEFLTNAGAVDSVPSFVPDRHRIRSVGSLNDPNAILDEQPSAIAIDHYKLDAGYERAFDGKGVVIVFDDLADRPHACDVVVDPTPGRAAADYAHLMEKKACLLLGPRYAQLWPIWSRLGRATRDRHLKGGPVRRIVVSLGATDPQNATARVLRALSAADLDADIDIILGSAAPHRAELHAMMGPRMRLHIDPKEYPELVATADLAIGAAGSSSFERSVLGLPSILVTLFDNQKNVGASFSAAGAADVVMANDLDDAAGFGERIVGLARDEERRIALSTAAASLTDGRGTFRLLAAMAGIAIGAGGTRLRLRLVEQEDSDWILDLQKHPDTRRYFRNPAAPTAEEHRRWMQLTLADPDVFFALIEADDARAGTVRLDRHNDASGPRFEVSIVVDPRFQHRGVASAALRLVRQVVPRAFLDATVLPENEPSKRLFRGAGYAQVASDRYSSSPS